MNNQRIYWSGTKSELLELCYALHVCKLIEDYDGNTPTFLEICKMAFDYFNINSPQYPYLRICQMKQRKKKKASSLLYKSYKKVFES